MPHPRLIQSCREYGYRTLAIVLFILSGVARGQTTGELLIEPWDEDAFQANGEALVFPSGRLSAAGSSVQLSEVESEGRWRFGGEDEHGPSVGYALNFLSLRGSQHLLPSQLADASIGGAMPLGRIGQWSLAASGAVGYAGDRPFANGRAWYGRATLLAGRQLKPGTQLLFLLEYDGNRGILPDVPLPEVAYRSKVNDQLEYVLGYPTTSVTWKPFTRLELDMNWYVPDSFDASAEFTLSEHWSVFGGFSARDFPYHVSQLSGNRRLFFLENRLEAGLKWKVNDAFNFSVAGGYAFDRRFYRGFDEFDLKSVSSLSDQPYLRVALNLSF